MIIYAKLYLCIENELYTKQIFKMEKILVIGSAGQIGSELVMELRRVYGYDNVVATVHYTKPPEEVLESGPCEHMDVMNVHRLYEVVNKHKVNQIYHLAAVLSGSAEKKPLPSWGINMQSLLSVLELCRSQKIDKLFWPSSIAVFGPTTPRENTPQTTVMEPNTVYGISKLAGERWVEYYWNKYKVDTRGLRYPGIVSYKTEPGGGTTDYAVEIFYEAIKSGKYTCFLEANTKLPMQFMPDAIKATLDLMEAPAEKVKIRSNYNVGGMSFDPEMLANEIKKHIPEFEIQYKPDFRQAIAESWPASIDDSVARNDWGLTDEYDLPKMTEVMIREIRKKFGE